MNYVWSSRSSYATIMTSSGPNVDELDNFRRQWQNEVSRKRRPAAGPLSTTRPQDFQTQNVGHVRASGPQNFDKRNDDDFEPRTYHDLPDVESDLKLGASRSHLDQPKPVTALDHYEQAVEKESLGNLGDSLQLYRTAFKVSRLLNSRPLIAVEAVLTIRSLMTKSTNCTKRSTFRRLPLL